MKSNKDVSVAAEEGAPIKQPPTVSFFSGKPEFRASFFSKAIFLFIDPLVYRGYHTQLAPSDTFNFAVLNTKPLYDKFNAAWAEEQQKPEPSIAWAIFKGNWRTLIYTAALYCLSTALSLAGPLLLNQIVAGLSCYAAQEEVPQENLNCTPLSGLYYFCIGLFLAPLVQTFADNHQTWALNILGTRMRNSLMAAIYRKCLRLDNSALQAESTGKVVTLMSNDAQKIQDAMMAINTLWGSPILIIVVVVLLYMQLGWACFVGLAIMLLLAPMTGYLGKRLADLRRAIMKWTDMRVGIMNEVINGIQMIKFYAWETSFKKKAMYARANEARILKQMAKWQGLFGMFVFSGPVLVAIATFGTYVAAGNELTATNAYTALSLFALLRFPMTFLPMYLTMVINALVSLKRIAAFLKRTEAQGLEQGDEGVIEDMKPGHIKVENGVLTWDVALEKPTLKDISFDIRPGTLTMVVGTVGSGKSSILAALINHITRIKGRVGVGGSVAYVAQTAWILNDTVQENILLGAPLDPVRYRRAIELSQLVPDLEILPNGDLTEIGDRGVTLSGGQKQRVSIARAVYSDADVMILDDPLSAVDSHVGRALFEQCIQRELKGKTVVLVTNALQYLPYADNVLWMDEGTIKAQGSYQQLVAAGLNVAELVHVEGPGMGGEAEEGGKDALAAREEAAKKLAQQANHEAAAAGTRKLSSSITLVRQKQDGNRNLTGDETRESGTISGRVLYRYFTAGGGMVVVAGLVLLLCLEQGSRVYTDTWVGIWGEDSYKRSNWFYLGIYAGLGCTLGVFSYVRGLSFLYTCVNASLSLHNQLLHHLLRLPKSFFRHQPHRRILNRFSRDTEIMDTVLSQSLIQAFYCFATFVAVLIVITIATKWFGIAVVPITVIYITIQRYYIPTARELQRIESVSRSPIYSRFSETLAGVATIRAYRRASMFIDYSDQMMQNNACAYLTQRAANAWLAMRLDVMGMFILALAGVLCIQGAINPGLAGLCLVYSLDLTRYLKFGTQMASKAESDFNSAERVVQFLEPEQEAADDTPPEVEKVTVGWPSSGAITVEKLKMRYRPSMPLVLKGVSFDIGAAEKVGLVGRTGSGKSSLFLVLFRMVEPTDGRIIIDGVDIATLGLRKLRSSMSIIPQDPFMFSGTVRINLDPFSEHNDEELWRVLHDVGLRPIIAEFETKLETPVSDNGSNFSQGQRQLFCMARAMLRRSRILMMDEATASVDPETDTLIQRAVRNAFGNCTMLTIAHRLNTIMDSDRVLVLEDGLLVENDDPDKLLQKDTGIFSGMVDQTGASSSRYLRDIARSSSLQRSASRNKSFGRIGSMNDIADKQNMIVSAPYMLTRELQQLAQRLGPDGGSLTPTESLTAVPEVAEGAVGVTRHGSGGSNAGDKDASGPSGSGGDWSSSTSSSPTARQIDGLAPAAAGERDDKGKRAASGSL